MNKPQLYGLIVSGGYKLRQVLCTGKLEVLEITEAPNDPDMQCSEQAIIKQYTVGADIAASMFPLGHVLSIDLMDLLPQREPQLYGVVVNGVVRIQWVSCPETAFIIESRESLQIPAIPVITQSLEEFRVVGRMVHRQGFH